MRTLLRFALLAAAFGVLVAPATAQWVCLYATYDDNADGNATGHNTPSVGVISENTFIALVMNPTSNLNFMIPYVNADSALGRLYGYGYGTSALSGINQIWSDYGFDQVEMNDAAKSYTRS